MQKTWIVCLLLFFTVTLLSAQDEHGLGQKLDQFRQKLRDIYSQIYDLKQQTKENPSEELKQKIQALTQEAEELAKQIQAIQEKLHGEKPPQKDEPKPPKHTHPSEPVKKDGPPEQDKDREHLEREIQTKKQELHKIQEEMKNCDPEERSYLEVLRKKIMEELKGLHQKMGRSHEKRHDRPWGKEGKDKERKHSGKDEERPEHKHFGDRFRRNAMQNRPEVKEFLTQLQQESPDEYKKLMELREKNSREFGEHLRERIKEMMELRRVKDKDPEMYAIRKKEHELNRKVKQLAGEIRRTSGPEREKKIAELKGALEESFGMRTMMRQREIGHMEKELEKMKQQAQKRQQNKDIIIDQRLKELIGEEGEWVW
jgi:hypothetical protein